MSHAVSLFVGPLPALRVIAAASPRARIFALSASASAASYLVLPLTEDVHDDIHAAFGTGDWLDNGPMLSSSDLALAQRASRGTALAYVETDYFGGQGRQNAVLWRDGTLVLQPAELPSGSSRSRSLWPINAVLRGLGVSAALGHDEFDTLGVGRWRSNEAIIAEAVEVRTGS